MISKRNSIKKKIEELKGPCERNEVFTPEESFSPVELEQAFHRAYWSYRINGRSRMDADTFFNQIRQNLIDLISRELTDFNSARVQMTVWIRYRMEYEDGIIDRVWFPFNSRMMDIFQGSDLNKIVNEMFTQMKTQIENSALANGRFRFGEILFIDVNFHQFNLTRVSSYLHLPDWLANKKALVNLKNSNGECFKWSILSSLHYVEIKSNPEHISNLRLFEDNYDWGGLEFPLSVEGISKFEKKNGVIVNVLGVEEKMVYILRGKKYDYRKKVANLLLIAAGKQKHFRAIKSLSRLLASSNGKHKCKQHFCMNCLQGFPTEVSGDKHFECCKDNETVSTEVPKKGSLIKFQDSQYQFKVPFIVYADFEAIPEPIQATNPNPDSSYTKDVNQHTPSGFCVNTKFTYGVFENPVKI